MKVQQAALISLRRSMVLAVFAGSCSAIALGQAGSSANAGINPGRSTAKLASAAKASGAQPVGQANAAGQPTDPNAKARVRVTEQNTVDLHIKDEELSSVLELLAIQGQKNIIVSKNVSGKVTMNLWGVTFFEALDALLHANGFAYVEKGNFIYVYTVEELEKLEKTFKKRVAKVVRLNYLNAPDAAEFVKGMLSKDGEIKTTPKTEDFSIGDDAPVGKDDFTLGASIVVTDYEENITQIEALLRELDTKPSQVLIEATVLQSNVTEDNAFGVDFSALSGLEFIDFDLLGAGPRGVIDGLINGGADPSRGITNTGTSGGVQSTVGGTAGRGGLKLGYINNSIGAFVRVLDEISDTTVLANPKLLTLNRMPSRVLVGRRVAYLSTTATETSTTQSVQYLDTGVQLYVRPFVTNSREIRLEIKPQVSSADVREIRAVGSGGTVTVPDEVTQEVVTNIIVPDAMTVVIGGLFTETTTNGRNQVPYLGDIPVLGAAFRGQSTALNRQEIIFLVTPSIVNDTTLVSQGEQGKAIEDHMRSGTRQGMLPFSRERRSSDLNMQAELAAREGNHERALMLINQSLQIRPNNEDALRLRDRILGEREQWPSGSRLPGVVGTEVRDRLRQVPVPAERPKYRPPFPQVDMPRLPLPSPDRVSNEPTKIDSEISPLPPGWDKIEHLFQPNKDVANVNFSNLKLNFDPSLQPQAESMGQQYQQPLAVTTQPGGQLDFQPAVQQYAPGITMSASFQPVAPQAPLPAAVVTREDLSALAGALPASIPGTTGLFQQPQPQAATQVAGAQQAQPQPAADVSKETTTATVPTAAPITNP
jgi:type IV pilus assembly protein PilQ